LTSNVFVVEETGDETREKVTAAISELEKKTGGLGIDKKLRSRGYKIASLALSEHLTELCNCALLVEYYI
jgi:hypothetical protein